MLDISIFVLDACVLYPPSLRDVLLTLAALDAFEIRWSAKILDELRRNVLTDNRDIDPERFTSHTLSAMHRAFPRALEAPSQATIDGMDNHSKDRHVAALALDSGADGIVTLNVKDFRSRVLDEASIDVVTPGALVDQLLDDAPDVVTTAVRHLSARWRNPACTPVNICEGLAAHPTMAEPMTRTQRLLSR